MSLDRRKAIAAAASVSLAVLAGSTAMAVSAGLLRSDPPEGVGEISAVVAPVPAPGAEQVVGPDGARTIVLTVPDPAYLTETAYLPGAHDDDEHEDDEDEDDEREWPGAKDDD